MNYVVLLRDIWKEMNEPPDFSPEADNDMIKED